ncbi:calcium-binding protein [Sagittula sp. SSi028]|uniref:calcium-binding protein n=1 Tax=Sagittula sp. SSi028 TaxID=3400636 RepID=UPI003AF99AAA
MFFLAGVLGMMALGSVVIASTSVSDDDEYIEDEGVAPAVQDVVLPEEAASSVDPVAEPTDPVAAEAPEGGTLFARLGLINVDGADPDLPVDAMQSGGSDTDLLDGAEGADRLIGLGGDDLMHGFGGADQLDGGAGADTLHGEAGNDRLSGGAGDDALFGHDGADILDGGAGADVADGGLGGDMLRGGTGDDALHGREGADTLIGGEGEDTLFGGWGDDLVVGVAPNVFGADMDGADYLNGGDGDDSLLAGSEDVLHGGAGADMMVLGHWITGQGAALADFDSTEDQLVIVYDDSDAEADPELTTRASANDPEMSEIVLDGQVLAEMPTLDLPDPQAMVLVGESLADALFRS